MDNSNCFELKTMQSRAFKTLIESLKDILTECNMEITPEGLHINQLDNKKTSLVYLKLHSSKFKHFECDVNILNLGINLDNFYKIIKTMTDTNILLLYVKNDDRSKLGITIYKEHKITNYKLKLYDIDPSELPKLDEENIDVLIRMPSVDFKKICADMTILCCKYMEIKVFESTLYLNCESDFAEQETIIEPSDDGISINYNNEQNKNSLIQLKYCLNKLTTFSKCSGLNTTVEIFLKNDFPIILKYNVGSLGTISLCLSPTLEED